jgi:nicotinamide phosphoribosyltransferase
MGKEFIMKTNPEAIDFLDYQFHDFSMRGMGGKSAIVNSGLGFCNRIKSSDTLPVIPAARMYYDEVEPCINSIASEHAIMCSLTGFFMQNAR